MRKNGVMIKVGRYLLGSLFLAALIFVGFADYAIAKPITLKVQVWQGPNHMVTTSVRELAPAMEKISGGRLKLAVYDTGSLVPADEFLEGIEKGIVDIAWWYPMRNATTFPFFDIGSGIPLIYNSITTCQKTWDDPAMISLVGEVISEKGYRNVGLGPYFTSSGFFSMAFVNKKVRIPSDIKGLKIMVRGKTAMKFFDEFGAKTISVGTAEIYEALTRGIIDGTWGVQPNFVDWNWMDPCKYYLDLPFIALVNAYIYNKAKIEGLPNDLKEMVKTWLSWSSHKLQLLIFQKSEGYSAQMQRHMEFYKPTPSEEKLWVAPRQKMIDYFIGTVGDRGKRGMEIVKKYNQ